MAVPSRKDRERMARSDLILDIALRLMEQDGFANLNMERIAEIAEYSKGTIYLHYGSKEEVLMHVCIRGLGTWLEYFAKARGFPGLSRERLLAMHWAHHFFAVLNPVEYEAIYLVKAPGIAEKISAQAHSTYDERIGQVLQAVAGVVEEAVQAGDVELTPPLDPMNLVFGFWALHYGSLMLQKHEIPYRRMGVGPSGEIKRAMLRSVLDGVGWRPLSTEHDYGRTTEQILATLLRQERDRASSLPPEQQLGN
jgi:AcrR family transcriptional regulator